MHEQGSREERLGRALAAIDAVNGEDPRRVLTPAGERPKELAEAERVSAWLARLMPAAGEALQLAARGHHLRRWTVPRSSHPEGRTGYLQWRRSLHDLHAAEVAPLLLDHGYDQATVGRVQDLIRKKGLGRTQDPDAEVQALEDAICLAFLDGGELVELGTRLTDDHLVGVIRKTLGKMSPAGRALALTLPLGPREAALVGRALSEPGSTGSNEDR